MDVLNLKISTQRTSCLFLYCGVVIALLFVEPYGASAPNNTDGNINIASVANVVCPSGRKCFDSAFQNVSVVIGYNGKICPGQSAQECYNESDPRGFVGGPRQHPVVIYQGDRLILKPQEKYNFDIKVYNVSRSAFDTCNFTGATKVIDYFTKLPFELPEEFIQTVGFKYFIVESNNMVIQCRFGLKLEVSVRSRDQCVSPSPPENGVCSSKGLCAATYGKFFTYNASCVCDTGYLGSYCEERDSCHTRLNPCHNGATCIDKKSGLEDEYNCSCVSGYDGKNCENNIEYCPSQPCKNGAICLDEVNKYRCLCPPGYFGTNCENLSADKCELKPCQNGGTCKRTGENRLNYTCICVDTFTGMNCTENVTISSSIVASSSVIMTTGKSIAVSDVHSQTLMLDTTHLSLKARFTTLQTAFPSLSTSVELPTSSNAMLSSFTLQKTSSTSKYSVAQSLVPSTHLSVSSFFTLEPSLTNKAPFVSLSTHSSSLNSSLPLVIVTEDVQGIISSSVLSKPTPLSITPLSSLGTKQMSSISSSSFMKTTSLMSSTVSSVLLKPSSWSITPQAKSSGTVQTASTKDSSFTNTTFYIPSTALASSVVTSSVFSTTVTPSLTSLVASSSQLLTAEPSTSTLTFSNLSLSSSSTRSSIVLSTQIIPTSTLSAAMTSSVYPTTTLPPTTATPTTLPPTTATPTTLPPTTVPLKEQTCRNMPCNNGTCQDVPDQHGLNFTCQCPQPSYGPRCSIDFTLHFPRFSSNSYLVHKKMAFGPGLNKIVITFKTTADNGLLLYSTHSKHTDFIQLYIVDGKLEYRFDPGDYLSVIKSPVTVNTDKILTAVITYDSRNKEGSLQVDKNAKLTKTSLGNLQGIGLYNNWYIGGLPPGKKIGGLDGSRATIPFIGCIKDIELNGNQIGFEEAIQWNDLSECDTPCNGTHKPCQNNGQCIPDAYDPHEYECKCLVGFKGKNCKSPSICSGDPCKGGLCILDKSSTNTSKICLCPFGRGGRECENELNISVPMFTMVYDYPSFIQYQVPTLSGPYFEVSLQFKIEPNSSSWDNALLVFSGQNQYLGKGDDFIALGINNSQILFQYNLGSGIANIWSDVIDGTREWHSLTAFRKKNKGYLFLDNQKVKEGSSPGDLTGLNLYSPLFLGGVADLSELPTDVSFKRGLEGSIINAAVRFGENKPFNRLLTSQHASGANKWPVVAGRNIGNEGYSGCNASQPCQNNGTCSQKGATITCSCVDGWKGMYCANRELPCVNYNPCATNSTCREVNNKAVCDCPLGKSGDTCSSAISIQQPRFKENSYMALTLIRPYIREITEITIKFIPYNENGLLFYIPFKITSQKGDFLSISLHNGFVQYRYDLGSGIDAKQSRRNISLNNEHTVIVTRNKQIGTLVVDEEEAVAVSSPGKAVALDVSSNFYLGGVPQLSSVNPLAVPDAKSLKDFVGCVVSVTVNRVSLTLTETGAVGGRNIDNCPASKSKASDNNLA